MLSPKNQRINKNNKIRRKFSVLRFLFFLISIAFVAVLMYALFFSEFLEITTVDIVGNEKINREAVLENINSKIYGEYLGIIKKNNLLLVRTGKIKKDLLESFKIIRKVETKRKFPNKLEIIIFERKPQLIFCGGDKCFMLDENREAYEEINLNQNDSVNNFIILTDENSKGINLGDFILDQSYLEYVLGIKVKLEEIGLKIENNFKAKSFVSKDIRIKTKEGPPRVDERSFPPASPNRGERVEAGWEIYFNEDINLEKEIEMLKVVLENKIEKNQRQDLEYVDLRIDNKIYYKFKDSTVSQSAKPIEEIKTK
ncbi:MAG: hypothetical protein COX29_02135 [Candidatus Moranbacteria bacterium CG23_combo_of_CG06-09_8_20_14_all_35_22]|nr:MAG: hypothetical protein COX29_02135 [Candidatus Moranbacteria bacterium CG23_combo_of_CG06-09_8_20_14_all_35_22]